MNFEQSRKSGGFSLIEIMVGLTIGLITILVIGQVMQVAEARKKTTTSGADATVNAALGLYTIERDAKNAGYGMTALKAAVGCPIVAKHGANDIDDLMLVPAVITNGAAGAPDSVRFLASNKSGPSLPTKISSPHPKTAANFIVESTLGVEVGDVMLAVPSVLSTATPPTTWCSIFVHHHGGGTVAKNQLLHPQGQSPLNHAGGNAIWPNGGYVPGDTIINLGSLADSTYSIRANKYLQLSRFNIGSNTSTETDLYPDIVQLQAVYGLDTDNNDRVDDWSDASPTTPAGWQQVLAVRVALVARSQNRELQPVTLDGANAASTCASASPHPAAVCWKPDPEGDGVKIDVSANNADWQRYRYRVLETTVPLRNVIWQQ